MKGYFQRFISLSAISILSILLIGSCKKMEDNYQQFIENGETIYIGKADSIVVKGGDNRVEVSWLLMSDPKVSSYKLYWNGRRDSIQNTVIKTDKVDTVRVMLNDMSEGTHHFEIVTFDKFGNSSVPAHASGKVYGSKYESTLLNSNRIIRALDRDDKDLIINWMPAAGTLAGVELEYVNTDGETEVHSIASSLDVYILPNFPNDGTFKHKSLFVPEALAIDTFHTAFEDTRVDDRMLRAKRISFTTRTQYGAQNDQLSVLISQDFNGIYDAENINAATWIDITTEYPFATANVARAWGPKDVTDMLLDGPIYVAFKYVFDPNKDGGQRTWRVESFEVQTLDGRTTINQSEAQFQLIHESAYEVGRSSITPSLIQLRGNAVNLTDHKVDWAISKALR